ncbi:capsule assembly Wzi family protein [Psychromonas antarctica]|uniref:capsule assembly Wzi family protein n=1 Tax=Psychromonas antarctica TaxID=67573 RepID=UPI001EE7B5CD|nr:capsule assembly Wzi family protein [Psychromonas antarctica]MCG6202592.1 capsule assembly Wzi family protein [Psychromonas antarctica]
MKKAIFTLLLLISANASASYHWIDANNLHLRADIQLLADVGIVKVPTTTYPLMWSGVMQGINETLPEDIPAQAKGSYERVVKYYNNLKNSRYKIDLSVAGATKKPRFQHYGTPVQEKAQAAIAVTGESEYFAYRLKSSAVYDSTDGDELRLDGSYLSLLLGNWVFTAGSYDEWYGQGWDTALMKSSNTRSMPTLSVSRNNPQAFTLPVLKWLGPWTLTTGISWMNDDQYRSIDNALLWSFRTSFKPHPNFEFGITRTAQLCGDDKGCGVSTWWDMLSGDSNVYTGENPANQLAAVDFRWGSTLYGMPYGIYWESMGEDSMQLNRFPPFEEHSYLMGLDMSYRAFNQSIRTFFEYTETNAACGGDGDCTYEHSTYKGGYRYQSKSIGSTYDNDARTYVLGFIGNSDNGHQWKSNLRYLDLNVDNSNANAPGGNTVAAMAEQATQFDFTYIFPLLQGKLETGASYTYSTYSNDIKNDNNIALWANWDYQF